MEIVIPRTVGVENVTTGRPLSGETGGSQIFWVTIVNKIVWKFLVYWQLPRVRSVPGGSI